MKSCRRVQCVYDSNHMIRSSSRVPKLISQDDNHRGAGWLVLHWTAVTIPWSQTLYYLTGPTCASLFGFLWALWQTTDVRGGRRPTDETYGTETMCNKWTCFFPTIFYFCFSVVVCNTWSSSARQHFDCIWNQRVAPDFKVLDRPLASLQ